MSASFQIAVRPGDGIALDVTGEAVRVLQAVESKFPNLKLGLRGVSVGAGEYLKNGDLDDEQARCGRQALHDGDDRPDH